MFVFIGLTLSAFNQQNFPPTSSSLQFTPKSSCYVYCMLLAFAFKSYIYLYSPMFSRRFVTFCPHLFVAQLGVNIAIYVTQARFMYRYIIDLENCLSFIQLIIISFIEDRQYTVYLNITNEDYKEGLRDHESLEFLNFAQAVRAAVSTKTFFRML